MIMTGGLIVIAIVIMSTAVVLLQPNSPSYASDSFGRVMTVFPTDDGIQQLKDSIDFPSSLFVGIYPDRTTAPSTKNWTNYADRMAIDDATIFAIVGQPMYFTNGTTRVFQFQHMWFGYYVFRHDGRWYITGFAGEVYSVPVADIIALAD